jgi:hypothetical protein
MIDNTIQQDNSIGHRIVLLRHISRARCDQRAGESALKVVLEVDRFDLWDLVCRDGLRDPEIGIIKFTLEFLLNVVSEDYQSPSHGLWCPTTNAGEIVEAPSNMPDTRRDDLDGWLTRGDTSMLDGVRAFQYVLTSVLKFLNPKFLTVSSPNRAKSLLCLFL